MAMLSNETPGRLDRAIDRAVGELMQVDPRPGLRHRVAGRLDAPVRRTSWIVQAATAAVLVAVMVVSWMLLRGPAAPPAAPSQTAVSPALAPATPPAQTHASIPTPVTTEPARVPARRPQTRLEADFGPRRGRVAAANVDTAKPRGAAYAASPLPPGGAVAPIAPIMILPIEVQPIVIAPLTFSAMPIRR
jgi:hypothetical protein